ncbi:hypothetical protein [Streptomyces sp. NPDC090798]|uniref:hypothetical protein n=1 Tax=Streptomyces sp. NPDC090798 TaxID=3365968 RepID=UPI0037F391BD
MAVVADCGRRRMPGELPYQAAPSATTTEVVRRAFDPGGEALWDLKVPIQNNASSTSRTSPRNAQYARHRPTKAGAGTPRSPIRAVEVTRVATALR